MWESQTYFATFAALHRLLNLRVLRIEVTHAVASTHLHVGVSPVDHDFPQAPQPTTRHSQVFNGFIIHPLLDT